MTSENTFTMAFRDEILELLSPLVSAVQEPRGIENLLEAIGRSGDLDDHPDLRTEIKRLAELSQSLSELDASTLESWQGLDKVLSISRDILNSVQQLDRLFSD